MKYKMIVSDFDDTLLRSDDTIGERTTAAIKKYVQAGGVFTISTGRMHKSILQRLPELGLDQISIPLMSFQGAMIVDSLSGEEILSQEISKDILYKIAVECEKLGVYYQIYSFTELFVEKVNDLNTLYADKVKVELTEVGNLIEFIKNTNQKLIKLLIVEEKDKIDKLAEHFTNTFVGDVTFFVSHPTLLECVSVNAGKGNGIRFAAEKLGIGIDEVIAIGDSMNDYSMVEAVGLGVAVANARGELREIAGFIAADNDNDGVGEVIELFGFLE